MGFLFSIITAPIRFLITAIQSFIMVMVLLILLIVCPIFSYFTLIGYEHQANTTIQSLEDNYRHFAVMDFSTNTLIEIPTDGSKAYITSFPEGDDYKSLNATNLGSVPSDWGFWNVVGFYKDSETWFRGKEAPMYRAYAEASVSSDDLRKSLTDMGEDDYKKLHHGAPNPHPAIVYLRDAPKIGMGFVSGKLWADMTHNLILFGVCPADNCDKDNDLQFHEARDLFLPSVSKGQEEAIHQMESTMEGDYWVREAHANGIMTHDKDLRIRAEVTKLTLQDTYSDYITPAYWMVGAEFTYLLFVAILVFRFFRGVYRFLFA